jgi:hypothetical protein
MDDSFNASSNFGNSTTFGNSTSFGTSSLNGSMSVPNLPGYVSNKPKIGNKTQGFTTINGVRIENTSKDTKTATRSMGSSTLLAGGDSTPELTPRSKNTNPGLTNSRAIWLNQAQKVYRFYGYFKEAVVESAKENERVRRVTLYYYAEDGTIMIIEHAVPNSGIPQGTFLKRSRIPKDGNYGGEYGIEELCAFEDITVYRRRMRIVDADAAARAEFPSIPSPRDYPEDRYSHERSEHMKMETGADTSVRRNVKKGAMKKHMEATLGNTVNTSGLEQFLNNDRKVLRFQAVWDDRGSMFGDYNFFTIHYYLADDTIEVLEQHQANNGKDPFPLLLARNKVLKNPETHDPNGRSDEDNKDDYYNWVDFNVGDTVNIFRREFKLINADPFTREFYASQGIEIRPDIDDQFVEAPKPKPLNPVPKHSGIGSEQDSLASCYALVPKPPKTEFDKKGVSLPSTILRFQAKMKTDIPADVNRMFVIAYFVATSEIQVREPPQRNSGIVGGNYLSKRKMLNSVTGETFQPWDFYAGAEISMINPPDKLKCATFVIQDVDEYTLSYMEGNPSDFPLSNFEQCVALLEKFRQQAGISQDEFFQQLDRNKDGRLGVQEFGVVVRRIFEIYGVNVGSECPDQVAITIFRTLDKDKSGSISLSEFRDAL